MFPVLARRPHPSPGTSVDSDPGRGQEWRPPLKLGKALRQWGFLPILLTPGSCLWGHFLWADQ